MTDVRGGGGGSGDGDVGYHKVKAVPWWTLLPNGNVINTCNTSVADFVKLQLILSKMHWKGHNILHPVRKKAQNETTKTRYRRCIAFELEYQLDSLIFI